MTEFESLVPWGWEPGRAGDLPEGKMPARVVRQERDRFFLIGPDGPEVGVLPGNMVKDALRPVTGDWVATEPIEADDKRLITDVLPRASELARQAAGEQTRKQVIAANVDLVLILMGLDGDFNIRRIERYLRLVSARNIEARILLNKLDLVENADEQIAEVKRVAEGIPVMALSAKSGQGLEELDASLVPGKTIVVVGSSGVGKSTLINHLLGEAMLATQEVREGDDRGRHTTTQRELIKLPSGVLMIDTPGIRELSEWQEEDDEESAEERLQNQIDELALHCKFRDCGHTNEPGCAVVEAMERGELDADRVASWHKLQAELKEQAKRQEEAARRKERQMRGRSRRIKPSKKR